MSRKIPKTVTKFYLQAIKGRLLLFIPMSMVALIVWPLDLNGPPYLSKIFVDRLTANPNLDALELAYPLILILILKFSTNFLNRLYDYMWLKFVTKMKRDTQISFFAYTTGQPYSYFAQNMSGSIAQNIVSVVSRGERILDFFVSLLFPMLLGIVVQVVVASKMSYIFGIIFGARFLVHMSIVALMGTSALKASQQYSRAMVKLAGNMIDSIANFINVKAFGSSDFEVRYIGRSAEEEFNKKEKALMETLKIKTILNFIDIIIFVVFFSFLISLKREGKVSAGDFILIYQLHTNFSRATVWLSTQMALILQSIGGLREHLEKLSVDYEIKDVQGAKDFKVTEGKISFINVGFGYGKEKIFNNFNLEIRGKERVGLIGASGAGKTSLLNLIMRFYEPEEGNILIDGQDISQVKQNSLRRSVSLITQEPILFNRTIKENISYGFEKVDDALLKKSAKKAYCHDFIQKLEDGYESKVGERGVSLSGGQRQRIAIARAVYKNGPILILDEATSALDSETEAYIQKSINNLIKNRTTIAIAHRLSTIVNLDRLIVIRDGEIVEQGSHEQLLKVDGYYAKLWNMQSNGFLVYEDGEE